MALTGTDIEIIDTDTHLTEPPTLWADRLPNRFRDEGPKVVNVDGTERWSLGGRLLNTVTIFSQGTAAAPQSWEDIDPACWDGPSRLKWMDANEIDVQALYPNLVAFEGYAVMELEPDLQRLVVSTYNDYVVEFASVGPKRFIKIAALPFWDIDESIAEMTRCRDLGFVGVVWAAQMEKHGLPGIGDPYWDRFYAAAQDLNMSVNFHVGIGKTEEEMDVAAFRNGIMYTPAAHTKRSALAFMSNTGTISELITSGVCHRFPKLKFVSVESGFGYVPFLLEALDWQWMNSGGPIDYPDLLLPSEYFRRQISAMIWFERKTLRLLDMFPENVMFSTDFPHPTSLSPRPYLPAVIPSAKELALSHLSELPDELARNLLGRNARKLYLS